MSSSPPDPPAVPARARFGWLDAARGIAAASVAFMHLGDETSPRFRELDLRYFNPGVFGVIVFFLVSGFVIPFSLERRGSLTAFVVGRFFRLYPLYWVSLTAVIAFHELGVGLLMPDFLSRYQANALWNVTMLQHWVSVPDAIGLYWSLAYEILFYATTALLFALGWNRRTDLLVALGALYFVTRGVLLALVTDSPFFEPQDFWVLTFFVGTLWYRARAGALSRRHVVTVSCAFGGAVLASTAVSFWVFEPPAPPRGAIHPMAAVSAWILAYAVFLLFMWTRAGEGNPVLRWLGKVSYSLYLLHGVIILIPLPLSAGQTLAVRVALLVPLCELAHRYVEKPAISLGRKVLALVAPSPSAAT